MMMMTSALSILLSYVVLVKRGRLGGISEMSLLIFRD
jgi:hypothetical protein